MKDDSKNSTIVAGWGYSVIKDGAIWIPVIMGKMSLVLKDLYEKTGIKRMIFSAVLNPDELKSHLRNIKREWDEWFPEAQEYSHCIEIEYEPFIEKIENLETNEKKI
jgi:hypothetical protein